MTQEAMRSALEALEHICRRLQMDIDDGSRPDQWSMEALVRKAAPAISQLSKALEDGGEAPTPKLAEVIAFLCGEAPLDGVWFGDPHPTERGPFWWRKHLLAAAPDASKGKRE